MEINELSSLDDLDYIRIHDEYVQRGKVNSYSLYYPEDSKVIILFLSKIGSICVKRK